MVRYQRLETGITQTSYQSLSTSRLLDKLVWSVTVPLPAKVILMFVPIAISTPLILKNLFATSHLLKRSFFVLCRNYHYHDLSNFTIITCFTFIKSSIIIALYNNQVLVCLFGISFSPINAHYCEPWLIVWWLRHDVKSERKHMSSVYFLRFRLMLVFFFPRLGSKT